MKIGGRPALSLLVALATALGSAPLAAAANTGTTTVSLTVEDFCSVDARPLIFGAQTIDHYSTEAQSSIVLACTPAASYVVSLDHGRHGAGSGRRMADAAGTRYVAYEIYRDAARTRRWGTTAASAISAVAPASGRVELAVYARLDAQQMQVGSYGDTITVTVSF